MAYALTEKQQTALRIIARQIAQTGMAPTLPEIGAEMGLRSRGGIHKMVTCLEERGWIRRLRGKTRAIEILVWPDDPGRCAHCGADLEGK